MLSLDMEVSSAKMEKPMPPRSSKVGDIIVGASGSLLASLVTVVINTTSLPPHAVEALQRQERGDRVSAEEILAGKSGGEDDLLEVETPADPASARALHRSIISSSHLNSHKPLLQGQVHVESRYNCNAESPVGARGCAQFMPKTWDEVAPKVDCNGQPRTNPECSFLGQISYMSQQMDWTRGADLDSAFGMYNEGVGNFRKRQDACRLIPGCNPMSWEGGLRAICLKSTRACDESERYVGAIRKAAQLFKDREVQVSLSW